MGREGRREGRREGGREGWREGGREGREGGMTVICAHNVYIHTYIHVINQMIIVTQQIHFDVRLCHAVCTPNNGT